MLHLFNGVLFCVEQGMNQSSWISLQIVEDILNMSWKRHFLWLYILTHLLCRTNGSSSRAEFGRSFLFFSLIYPSDVIDVDLLARPLLIFWTANPTINLLDSFPILLLCTSSPFLYTSWYLLMLDLLTDIYTMIFGIPKGFLLLHTCTPKLFSCYDFKTCY